MIKTVFFWINTLLFVSTFSFYLVGKLSSPKPLELFSFRCLDLISQQFSCCADMLQGGRAVSRQKKCSLFKISNSSWRHRWLQAVLVSIADQEEYTSFFLQCHCWKNVSAAEHTLCRTLTCFLLVLGTTKCAGTFINVSYHWWSAQAGVS